MDSAAFGQFSLDQIDGLGGLRQEAVRALDEETPRVTLPDMSDIQPLPDARCNEGRVIVLYEAGNVSSASKNDYLEAMGPR